MGTSIPLGRIAGIRIGFNWSVLVVVAIFTFSLAEGRFPNDFPGLGPGAYWAAGAVGAALFFVSLLAHEMGHALVARREGVGVVGIDLWLLGGVAKLEGEARTAGAELRIAAVGPLTSLATGAAFLALNLLVELFGVHGLAGSVFAWLAVINVVLAVFNIMPAAPLDGGRVLSALLWMRSGERTRATVTAAQVGRGFGYLLIGYGAYELFIRGSDAGLWTALVGWYIVGAATAELRSAPVIGALAGVTVGQAMLPDPPLAPDWMTLEAFAAQMPTGAHQAFPVQAFDGSISGLLTLAQLRAVPADTRAQLRVSELAFPIDRVVTAGTGDELLATARRLACQPTEHAIVQADDWRVVGIVGPAEIDAAARRPAPSSALAPPPPPPAAPRPATHVPPGESPWPTRSAPEPDESSRGPWPGRRA
ncbi:site-2 protease family protein [soil metagenome]